VPFTGPVRAGPAATLLAPGPAPGPLPAARAVVAAVRRRSASFAAPPVVAAVRPPVSPVPSAAVPVHNSYDDLFPYFLMLSGQELCLREQSVCLFVSIVEIAS